LSDRPTSDTAQTATQAGRPRTGRAGLLLLGAVLVAVVALVVGLVVWLGEDSYEVDDPASVGTSADAGGASATLLDFVVAARAGDAERLAELAPAGDRAAADLLQAVGDNARALDLSDVDARYVDEVGPVDLDGSWAAVVDLTWGISGFDERPATTAVVVQFRTQDGQVAIEGFGPEDAAATGAARGRLPLWLTGPLSVVRTSDVLVAVADDQRAAREWADRVRRGIPVVRRVLTQWQPKAVVEVPATPDGVDALVGAEPGTYAGIAAVTASADGSTGPDAPMRVVVNPDVTGRLRKLGAQVVTTHELVHVATDASAGAVPPWLLEGFADYVALRDVELPPQVAASRALALVEREGLPDALPGSEELGTSATDLDARYEMAWLACQVLADSAGERALVATYDAVDAGVPVGRALRLHAGMSEAELVERWRTRLAELVE